MNAINVNGQVMSPDQAFAGIDHRGLKYGDGLFESIRMLDGKIPLLSDHLRRLYRGMNFLKIEKPKQFSASFFRKEFRKIISTHKNVRIRLSVFRTPGGFYTPASNEATYVIEYQLIETANWEWKSRGLKVRICPDIRLPVNGWSSLKTTNSLPYVLAGLWKKEVQIDDCILLNQAGFVAEASSSNVFYFKNGTLFTPSDNSGAIGGVMRHHLIRRAKKEGFELIKTSTLPSDLLEADEVFLTNAVRGISWVTELEGNELKKGETKKFFERCLG